MGVFKLGKMTFGSLFKKPETVLYPIETKPQPAGLKGHIEIDVSTCILCGLCEKSCPTDCITVDKATSTWSTNPFACIQCGYCVTVCPKKSLSMLPGYHVANTVKDHVVAAVPEKAKPARKADVAKASEPAKADEPAKAVEPAKSADHAKPAAEAKAAEAASLEQGELRIDAELEAKLALMSDESAAKVRAALQAGK